MVAVLNFLNKILGFCYVFNLFQILSKKDTNWKFSRCLLINFTHVRCKFRFSINHFLISPITQVCKVLLLESVKLFPKCFFAQNPNPSSELFHHVRILRYLRLCTRKIGFFAIFEVMYRAHNIFWSSLQVASCSTTLTFQNQLLNDHQRFFFAKLRPF